MQTYICKCGKRFKKSSTAESTEYKLTGYSAAHECYGCPYIIAHRDWQTQEITKYTCRATQTITYGSCCSIGTADKDYTVCYLYTLDIDFAKRVCEYTRQQEGALISPFEHEYANVVPSEWRDADFGKIYACKCAGLASIYLSFQPNKKGTEARRNVKNKFFSSDGHRLDMTAEEEKEHILRVIQTAKIKAKHEALHEYEEAKTMVAFDLGEMLSDRNSSAADQVSVIKIPLGLLHSFTDIDENEQPFNVSPSASDYIALKDSIKKNGLMTPIIVRKITEGEHIGEYEILSGHRRRLACAELGMQTIDAIVVNVDKGAAYDNVVDTNIYRAKTEPIELARMYSYYLKHRKDNVNSIMTAEMIASKFSIGKKQMYRYIKLLNFTEHMQECFNLGYIKIANIEQLYTAIIAPALEVGASKQIKERSINQQGIISSYALNEEAKFTGKRMKKLLALIEIKPDFTIADIDEMVFSSDSEIDIESVSETKESDGPAEADDTETVTKGRFSSSFFNRVAERFPEIAEGVSEEELESRIFDILNSAM